eukprot:g73442.t1
MFIACQHQHATVHRDNPASAQRHDRGYIPAHLPPSSPSATRADEWAEVRKPPKAHVHLSPFQLEELTKGKTCTMSMSLPCPLTAAPAANNSTPNRRVAM